MSLRDLYIDTSDIQGLGIRSLKTFKKGDFVANIPGDLVNFEPKSEIEAATIPTWYGVTDTLWINPGNSVFRCLNHSCEPNVALVSARKVVARKDIVAGVELTIDYSMTDADTNWKLDHQCQCGSKNCRKTITSIQSLPVDVFMDHLPLIPKFFQQAFLKAHPNVKI